MCRVLFIHSHTRAIHTVASDFCVSAFRFGSCFERMRSLYEWVKLFCGGCNACICKFVSEHIYVRLMQQRNDTGSKQGTMNTSLCVGGKFIFLFCVLNIFILKREKECLFEIVQYRSMRGVMKIYVTIVLRQVGCMKVFDNWVGRCGLRINVPSQILSTGTRVFNYYFFCF